MKKNYLYIIAIYALVFLVINVLLFTCFPPSKITVESGTTVFWASYGFLCAGLLANILCVCGINRKKGVDAIFMGIPLISISFFHFAVAFISSSLFMILAASNVNVPVPVAIIIQLILLVVFAIMALMALLTKNTISTINETIKKNVTNIRNLADTVEIFSEKCDDAECKKALAKLADDIKYSDPMTNDTIAEVEAQMKKMIDVLETQIDCYDYSAALETTKRITFKLSERNKKLANSK